MQKTVAGRYRPLRELGRGAAGAVWLCQDEVLRREVAVKQVGRLPGETTHDVARAMREARSSAALHHPGVVTVFDVVEEDDTAWLVMEHVPSRPLSQVVAEEGPLEPRRVARLLAQVAGGLAAAHREGTVHRDVKPGNVLVTDDDVAKISDFGIARTGTDDQLTVSGIVVGTPAYFSPELARGGEPTAASDVWALGATVFAAVEGHPPYASQDNALAMLGRIATAPVPRAQHAGPLGPLLERMMDPDPARRTTMAEAEAELWAVSGGRGAPVAEPLTERFAAPTAGLAVAPLAEPPYDAPDDPADETDAEQAWGTAAPAPRRRRGVLLALAALVLVAALGGAAALGLVGDGTDEAAPGTTDPPAASEPAGESEEPAPESQPADPGPTPEATEEPEPEPTSAPSSPQESEEAEEPQSTTTPAAFVQSYYSLLPDDTGPAWEMLGAPVQARVGSYADYDGFWRTIDAVQVTGTSPAGPTTVDTTLAYTTDGSTESEVRRLTLERSGDGWLIVDDEVLG